MARRNWNGDVRTEREEHYTALLDEQEESGLSVAAFADEEGLSAATLYSWRRRLGRATPHDSGVALIQVCVDDDDELDESSGRMVVVIADGTRIELDADFDELAFERLLSVLDKC